MKHLLLSTLALLSAGTASATTTIDFSALSDGSVANPLVLPGATFTSVGGYNTYSIGNGLCAGPYDGVATICDAPLDIRFDAPLSALSFTFVGNNITTVGSSVGSVQLFSGSTLVATRDMLVSDTQAFSPDLVFLDNLGGVTSVTLNSTDFGGLLYDNFTLNPVRTATASVPEPATWAMMIAGFGLAGGMLRRRPATAYRRRRPYAAMA